MGRGGRHTAYHGSSSAATDAGSVADGRRFTEAAAFALPNGASPQPQGDSKVDGASSDTWRRTAGAVVNDICYTIEDRFILPQSISAVPPLHHEEEEEDRRSVTALIGYFMSISTLLAFAAYSRRLSNLMNGASPVMGEILLCVSHLAQVTQEQLGWSLFCSGFLSPGCFDWSAADGSGGGGAGVMAMGNGAVGGSGGGGGGVGVGSGATGSQAARRQALGGGTGGGGGGVGAGVAMAGAGGAGYASYSGGNVVRYLLGRKANNVMRQESLRSYLSSSFYSPSAFLVEQTCWFIVLVSTLDTVTLQRVAVASFFGNSVSWVPVYSVGALAALASALLFFFMYWVPSYEVDDAVLSALFLQTHVHHVMSAYCASLCVTLLFAESMLLDDLRRTFVAAIFSLPQRALRLSGNHPALAQALRLCGEIRRNYFYFVDFYFFLGIVFWYSLVLVETAGGISILGIAALLMVVPWLLGCGLTVTPLRAVKDTVIYAMFYGIVATAVVCVVPLEGLPFLSNAVQAAVILIFMVARCEHKHSNGCAYVLVWVAMLVVYLYEKEGTGRGAAGSVMWSPNEASSEVNFASAAQAALQDHVDPNVEAMGLVRTVCVTFWQLLSKGLSEERAKVLHFNVVVLGSMLLLSTTVRALAVEGVRLSPAGATATATATTSSSSVASTSVSSAVQFTAAAAAAVAAAPTATNANVRSKNGSIAGTAAKANASAAKLLGRASRQESHNESGLNLDSGDAAADTGVTPATSTGEEEAVEEAKTEREAAATPVPPAAAPLQLEEPAARKLASPTPAQAVAAPVATTAHAGQKEEATSADDVVSVAKEAPPDVAVLAEVEEKKPKEEVAPPAPAVAPPPTPASSLPATDVGKTETKTKGEGKEPAKVAATEEERVEVGMETREKEKKSKSVAVEAAAVEKKTPAVPSAGEKSTRSSPRPAASTPPLPTKTAATTGEAAAAVVSANSSPAPPTEEAKEALAAVDAPATSAAPTSAKKAAAPKQSAAAKEPPAESGKTMLAASAPAAPISPAAERPAVKVLADVPNLLENASPPQPSPSSAS